jgi:hypothetical protein
MVGRAENKARLDAAIAKSGWRPPLMVPPMPGRSIDQFAGMPTLSPRAFDPDLGNYPAGRAPVMNRTPLRGMPTPIDRVATRFAPDYSVAQYEDDVPPRQMGYSPPPMPFPSLNFEDAPGAALDAARAAPGAVVDAVRAAPRFVGEVAAVGSNALWQGTGIPALLRDAAGGPGSSSEAVGEGDLAYMMGDDSGARDFYRQAEGQRLGTAGQLAITTIGGGSAVQGVRALRAGEGLLESAAAFNAASKAPGMALPTYAAIGATTAAPFIAGQASAQGIDPALAIEDRYVREALESRATRVPARPDEQSARAAGFAQGASLDIWDDTQRNPAKIAERDRLRAEWNATPEDQRTGEQAARLMNAEQDADPVGFEAAANRGAFNEARFRGEMTTGAGTAILSGIAGLATKSPLLASLINGGAGAVKGALYGAGAGLGERSQDERVAGAIKDGVISTALSAGLVPLGKVVGGSVVKKIDAGRMAQGKPRLFAPTELRLRDDISPDDAWYLAGSADKMNQGTPVQLGQRLMNLVNDREDGRIPQIERALSRVVTTGQELKAPRIKGQIPPMAEDLALQMLSPGDDAMNMWRFLPAAQQKAVAVAVKRRLTNATPKNFSPDEQRLLASPEGAQRLAEIGLIDQARATNPLWPSFVGKPANIDAGKVNSVRDFIFGDYVPERLSPDTAAALGARAHMRGVLGSETMPINDPRGANNLGLKDLFVKEKALGPKRADERPSVLGQAADVIGKAGVLSFAIPATGVVSDVLGGEDRPKIPSMPLAADEALRRDLATLGLNADLAQANSALADVEKGFDEGRDVEIETWQKKADDLATEMRRLQSTKAQIPVAMPDGTIEFRDNRAARAAALAKAQKLAPDLKVARDKVESLTTNRPTDKASKAQAASQRVRGFEADRAVLAR